MPYSLNFNQRDNPFEGGTGIFDSRPYLDYYMKVLAHRNAVNEAFSKHLDELGKNLTPTGLNAMETNGHSDALDFSQKVNDWKGFGIQNKRALINGDIPATLKWNQIYQDALDLADKSKQNVANHLEAIKYYQQNPDNATPQIRQMLDNSILPISQGQKPFDMNMTIEPKNLDTAKYIEEKRKVYPVQQIGEPVYKPTSDPFWNNEITTKGNIPEQISKMSEDTGHDYKINPSFKNMIDKTIAPQIFQELDNGNNSTMKKYNDAFKSVYGKDMNLDPADHTDLAKAWGILNLPATPSPEIKPRENKKFAADYQDKIVQHHIMLEHNLKEADKADEDTKGGDAVLHNIFQSIDDGEKSKQATVMPAWMSKFNVPLDKNIIPVNDPNIIKAFEGLKKIGTTPVNADGVTYNKDTHVFNLVYNPIPMTDKDGNPIIDKDTKKQKVIPASTIPLTESDVVAAKVKELNPNKNIGTLNDKLMRVVNANGGLYNTTQKMYGGTNNQQPAQTVQPVKQSHTIKTKKGIAIPVFK